MNFLYRFSQEIVSWFTAPLMRSISYEVFMLFILAEGTLNPDSIYYSAKSIREYNNKNYRSLNDFKALFYYIHDGNIFKIFPYYFSFEKIFWVLSVFVFFKDGESWISHRFRTGVVVNKKLSLPIHPVCFSFSVTSLFNASLC